jgi:hypothetical protein
MQTTRTPPEDGRQSETALRVARGARRLLRAHGFASIVEMPLPSGRRADIVAIAPDGRIIIVEVKSSVADFRSDLKWPEYRLHCDRLYFAIPGDAPMEIFPEDAGLIVADAYGAEFMRDAPEHRIAGATRRSMLLRFGHLAAERLHLLWDSDLPG